MKSINQAFRTLLLAAAIGGSVPAYGGWLDSLIQVSRQGYEKTKEESQLALHSSKLAGHKTWESTLKGARYSRQFGTRTWSASKTGWHRFKVIAKP